MAKLNWYFEFRRIVASSKTPREAYNKARKVKGVSKSAADAFYKKYGRNGKRSPYQAFEAFYYDVKPKKTKKKMGYTYRKLSGHTKKAAAKKAATRARKTYRRVRVTGKTGAWKVMVHGKRSKGGKVGSCAVMLGSRGGRTTARKRRK